MNIVTSSDSTSSPFTDPPSKTEGIVWCCVFVLEAVLIVIGNLLTIFLFAVHKNLRKKSLALVVNMAFADLMLGAILMPFDIYLYTGDRYLLWTANSSTTLYIFHEIVAVVLFHASLISAAFIAGERLYSIFWPLKHRTLSMRAYTLFVLIAWTLTVLVSAVYTILLLLTLRKLAFIILMSFFLILLSIVCGCNVCIWRKFKHGRIASQQLNRTLQNQRLTKTLLLVSVLTLVSWLPVIIVNFLTFLHELSVPWRAYDITAAIHVSSSFANPVVYALRLPEFRRALGLFSLKKQAGINRERYGRKNNRVADLNSALQLETLGTDPIGKHLACKQKVMDN